MGVGCQQGTSLVFDRRDGLTLGVGTSSGHVLLYDLRSPRPLLVKEHANELPITKVAFHSGDGTAQPERRVLSTDAKVIKIWNRDGQNLQASSMDHFGAGHTGNWGESSNRSGYGSQGTVTNIETPAPANDVLCVRDGRGDTGLMLVAAEQPRVLSYYVPALGPAPRWCSFLDVVTEELEEGGGSGGDGGVGDASGMVYDDYKFLTEKEVQELGLGHLMGTPLLRGYMHGFFVDARLYAKVKSVAKPFEYEAWRKAKVQARVAERAQSRIDFSDRGDKAVPLPSVNRDLAARLLNLKDKGKKSAGAGKGDNSDDDDDEDEGPKKRKRKGKAKEGAKELASGLVRTADNPLGDNRFAKMFTSPDFEVETYSEEYKLRYPSGEGGRGDEEDDGVGVGGKRRATWEEDDSGDEILQGGSDEEEDDDDDEDDDSQGGDSSEDEDSDGNDDEDEEMPIRAEGVKRGKRPKAPAAKKGSEKKLRALSTGESAASLVGENLEAAAARRAERTKTLAERIAEKLGKPSGNGSSSSHASNDRGKGKGGGKGKGKGGFSGGAGGKGKGKRGKGGGKGAPSFGAGF